MKIIRSISRRLSDKQVDVVMRDICRTINYNSSINDIAQRHDSGLRCSSGWRALPEWIQIAELIVFGDEVKLHLDTSNTEEAIAKIDGIADSLQDELSSLFSHETKPYSSKVFCLGWSKTGTTSLTEALRVLGLFSWHSAPWVVDAHYGNVISEDFINLSEIADYTAVSDLPICALFRELDQAFPGSKYILTVRPAEDWVKSVACAMKDYIAKKDVLESDLSAVRWAYGTEKFDRSLFLQRYAQHNQQVLEYFKGRSDLLVMDIAEENKWQKLCSFLNLPLPDTPFPYLNKRAISNS
ncbi:sulfotransferase family protein [Methylomonas methanica]|uniref:Sulfotransferase family protein n=1 Tax=Methylomonas methanica (strain DSM 25384 / MC09) TaxID=857087 RepID=G0A7Q0_METMM|nr:sulfotransferase family protein [Methylomonas methanica]AEG01893.1 hypothetical protein Metme_3527 [Methylomonas methanica MC09]